LRVIGFLAGAILCLGVLTPLGTAFFQPLSPHEITAVLAGVALCGLAWLASGERPRCPICGVGMLRAENIGTTQQKLGIVDHPMFRPNTWTQWYRCSQCGYREWDEQADPPE
jgi:predicted nucleic-acid-binding Zn-ribbon protein